MKRIGYVWIALYIGTIFAANYAITRWGVVSVGFGLMAPAAVYFVGLAFTFRDLAQDRLGRAWIVGAILVGAALSAIVSPAFALASATAFLFSEGADFLVYTPIRDRAREQHNTNLWLVAVGASNAVGLLFDSVLFLWLAFGSLAFLPGQLVGKAWMTLLALLVLYPIRRREAVV